MNATPEEIHEALLAASRALAELDAAVPVADAVTATWCAVAGYYSKTVSELRKLSRPAECGEAACEATPACDFRQVRECADMWFCHTHYVVHDCGTDCRMQHQTPDGDSVCVLTGVARYDPVCWGTNFHEAPTTLTTRSRSQPRSEASRLRKRRQMTDMLFGAVGESDVAACLDAMLALRADVSEPSYTRERRAALAKAIHQGFCRMFQGQMVGVNALLGYVQFVLTFMCSDAPGYVLRDTVLVVPVVPWIREHVPDNKLQMSSVRPMLHNGRSAQLSSRHSRVVERYIVARVDAATPDERAALAFPRPATGASQKRKSNEVEPTSKRRKRAV